MSRRTRFAAAGIVAGVSLLYVLSRVLCIDRFVTSDEPLWLGRSANFLTALTQGNPDGTFQFAHPGVMTMWSGALAIWLVAPDYASTFSTPIDYVFNIHMRLREIGADPLDVMVAARISKILLQTVVFAVAAGFLVRNYGRGVALIAGALIALDPFVSAIDSVLHVDGLAAICMVTAILAIPRKTDFDGGTVVRWIISGVIAGMAVLTRWMAIVLFLPAAVMLAFKLIERLRQGQRWRSLWPPFLGGAIFTTSLVLTCLALWPALRHDPVMVFEGIWRFSADAATEGHGLPTFFLGTIHEGDPGTWFYPVVLVWRSTPVVLLGLVLLGVAMLRSRPRILNPRMSACLLTFALTMTLAMTVADKKFDRYLLSVNLVLMIFAAIGLHHAVCWVRRRWANIISRRGAWIKAIPAGLLAILIGGQLVSAVSSLPYRFAYVTPLVGGTEAAQDQLQLGWGEGMDQAAAIIENDHDRDGPDAPPATVRVTANREQILYFLPETWTVYPHNQEMQTVREWKETGYVVLSIQRWQRDLDPQIHDYLWQFTPLDSVFINGVEYLRIYRLDDIPPPPWLREE